MQPFTFDQAVIAGLLFLLGMLIGMYFLAGGKWKRRYTQEASRVRTLETENEHLRRDALAAESQRRAAVAAPAPRPPNVEERTTVVDRRASSDRRTPRAGDPPDIMDPDF